MPNYLIEDHPIPKPKGAMKIIDAVARQKGGNGIPASTLDIELSYMFRSG